MNVVFFGGEPLMNGSVISYIGGTVCEYCRAHGIDWQAGIITNGTLLTEEIAAELASVGVVWAKVTIDGDRKAHDRLRVTATGGGTFDRIWDNLQGAARHLRLIIGGNINDTNEATVPRLLDRLAAAPWRDAIMSVRFKPIGSFDKKHPLPSGSACQLSAFTKEQVGWMLRLREEIRARGLPVVSDPNVGPCDFFRPNTVSIGVDGALYPCPAFVGLPEFEMGNVVRGETTAFGEKVDGIRAWRESCHGCAYLPVCAGGCRVPAWLEHKDLSATVCDKVFYDAMVPRYVAACDAENRRGDVPRSMFI